MNFKEFKEKFQKVPIELYPNQVSESPLLSVCIQTYRHENYIRQCLDSILMQKTDFEFEILVAEDDSPDQTRRICKEYADPHPGKIRLFLHRRENNIKIAGTATGRFGFVYNIFSANGKYIALCEGDDYWTDPHKLQKQVDFLESNSGYSICYHDIKTIDKNGNILDESKLSQAQKNDFTADQLMRGAKIQALSMCYRNIIKDFPDEFYQAFGGDLFITCLLGKYGGGKYINEILPAVYRYHEGGISSGAKTEYKRLLNTLQTELALYMYYTRTGTEELSEYFLHEKIIHKIEMIKSLNPSDKVMRKASRNSPKSFLNKFKLFLA